MAFAEGNTFDPGLMQWLENAHEDAILQRMGETLLGDEVLGIGISDAGRYRSFAKMWFESRVQDIKSLVCAEQVFRELGGDLANDILVLLPLLGQHLDGDQMLAFLVAGIVLRRGIANFCDLRP